MGQSAHSLYPEASDGQSFEGKLFEGLRRLHGLRPWNGVGEFNLDGVRAVLRAFGDPQDKLSCIHVAGTNGKGSTVAYLSQILAEAGHSVGRVLSPHINSVNERIALSGVDISDHELDQIVSEVLSIADRLEVELTYFETITVVAFLYFERSRADYVVLEVGLGGRLDATNVIKSPKLAIITTISRDHEQLLGSTLAEIAGEKAGIIKEGSTVIVGQVNGEGRGAIHAAVREKSANYNELNDSFSVSHISNGVAQLESPLGTIPLRPGLEGLHQFDNAAVAGYAAQLLGVDAEAIERGIALTAFPGRLERFHIKGHEFIFDCAHNSEGVNALAAYLNQQNYRDLTLVAGFLKTKSWEDMLAKLVSYASRVHLAEPESERALSCDLAAEYLGTKVPSSGEKFTSVHYRNHRGLVDELFRSPEGNTVLVTGSIYLVAAIRALVLAEA